MARKVRRALTRAPIVSEEKRRMDLVRRTDKYCRFPWCGCRRFKLTLHVAHLEHRGMGGNPKGDRTAPELLILLCSARHRENAIALDRKTIRIRPLVAKLGTRGPCAFDIDMRTFRGQPAGPAKWLEVAREKAPHQLEYPSLAQQEILNVLQEMAA